MSLDHNGFTFTCDRSNRTLVIKAKTARTAIKHARAEGWSIVRIRVMSGVPKDMVATTIRLVLAPGLGYGVGLRRRR